MLLKLGFSKERAEYIADNIIVDPARGSGHAFGAGKRGDKAHLRTRVEKEGMNYKGYNIAVHEMGHNVEQTFSLNDIDHTLLSGRPEHRIHRGAGVRVPGARPGAARPRRSPTRRADALAHAERLLGNLRDRGRRARRHGRSGTGCTTTRTPRRRS